MPEFVVRRISFYPRPAPGDPEGDFPLTEVSHVDQPPRPAWGTLWAEPVHRNDHGERHRLVIDGPAEAIRAYGEPGDVFQLRDEFGR